MVKIAYPQKLNPLKISCYMISARAISTRSSRYITNIYKVKQDYSDSRVIVTNCISNDRFSYNKGGSQTFAVA